MRILQMVPSLEAGGVETGTIDIAKTLKKMGHDVYVMSSGGVLVKELVKAGVPHVTYPIHAKSLFSLSLVPVIAEFIRRERIEIVHARSRVPAWLGYLAARRQDCSFVTTCHGYYSEHFLSRVMGWGKEVIVISNIIGRHMIDHFNVPPERIHLIYRGVDLNQFPRHAGKYASADPKRKFVVANIGRITPIKGHQHFIKAFHLAKQRIPGLEGWIVGGPDAGKEKYFESLQALVKNLGLEKELLFLGKRQDISEILRETDLLTLTTHVPEAFGRVLIEAGASGTAVAATRVGGVVEVVESGKNGVLVSVNDEKELANVMVDLYEQPAKARALADAMRQKVEAHFSLETMTRKTVEIYDKARGQKRILFLKLGSLGDLILAVPSFRAARKKFPHAVIGLVVDSKWYGFIKGCPYLDQVWSYDRGRKNGRWTRLLKLAKRLRTEQFDLSVDLQNNTKTHLLAFLAGVPRRFGFRRRISSRLLTHAVPEPKEPVPPVQHQHRILSQIGVTELPDKLELWVREEDRQYVESLLKDAWVNDTQKLVGFSLSASAGWPTKNWPVEHFLELAKQLGTQMNARIFLLGDATALPLAEKFDREELPFVTNLVNKTTLQELAAVIGRLDALVTGDSAPMHIAAALETSTVALFGPTDSRRHIPPSRNLVVLKKDLKCAPCYSGKCKAREFACMPGIQVGEVFRTLQGLFAADKGILVS